MKYFPAKRTHKGAKAPNAEGKPWYNRQDKNKIKRVCSYGAKGQFTEMGEGLCTALGHTQASPMLQ